MFLREEEKYGHVMYLLVGPCLHRSSNKLVLIWFQTSFQKFVLKNHLLWIILHHRWTCKRKLSLLATKWEIMAEDRWSVYINPRHMQKKLQIVHIKQVQGKLNKANFTFYLLRSGGQPKLPSSILLLKFPFDVWLKWF